MTLQSFKDRQQLNKNCPESLHKDTTYNPMCGRIQATHFMR